MMPSVESVSNAYSISHKLAPTSGSGSDANMPNRDPAKNLGRAAQSFGFTVAQSTVARYMYRGWPPSQGWRTFLTNHIDGIAAIDLVVLPTITFRLLYCLVILRHGRRLWVSFGVTTKPT